MYTAAALTCLLTLPLAFADTVIQYVGSPGIMKVQSIAKTPGPGICDNIKTNGGKYAVRLPSNWMNGNNNCGRNLTIYFTPTDVVVGQSAAPTAMGEYGVVVDECPSTTCQSFESSVDDELFQEMDPGSKPSKAIPTPKVWGPVFAFID